MSVSYGKIYNDDSKLLTLCTFIFLAFLVYNNISNGDKIQCQRSTDATNSSNTFSSLFANVLGSENTKQNTSISDNSLIISLLKLSSSLIQTELPQQSSVR